MVSNTVLEKMAKTSLVLVVVAFLVSFNLTCEAQLDDTTSYTLLPAEVWTEITVNLTASEVWAVYSSPQLPKLIVDLLPTKFLRIDVVSGDGTLGTILNITIQPTSKGPLNWLEQFTKIDHRTRTKVVTKIKGGYLDIGYTKYENTFQIIPKGRGSCVIRSTISFIMKQGSESAAQFVGVNWAMPDAVINYIRTNKARDYLASKTSDS